MKVLHWETPSFSDWLASKDYKTQVQIELLMTLAPFLIGWGEFIYFWLILWWDTWDALPGPAVTTSIGYIAYFFWRDSIRAEAATLPAITFNIRWYEGVSLPAQNVVEAMMSLSEIDLFHGDMDHDKAPLVSLLEAEGMKPLENVPRNYPTTCPYCGVSLANEKWVAATCHQCGAYLPALNVHEDVLIGKYYTAALLKTPMRHPIEEEIKTRRLVFIHDFPRDKTFKKVIGPMFSHKGQLIAIPAASVDMTFIGWTTEIETVFYFRVTSCPERTRLMQIGIGIQPATSDVREVNRARRLESTTSAMDATLKANSEKARVKVLSDHYEDTDEKGLRVSFRLLGDMDRLREKRKEMGLRDKLTLRNILIFALLLGVAWWGLHYFGILGEPSTVAGVA